MLLIADNLQMTRPPYDRALADRDPHPIQNAVLACEAAGAEAIDINTGPLGKDAVQQMTFVVEAVQEVTRLPLVIDTANPEAMAAGVSTCRNPLIINGFSLEPVKLERILPLAIEREVDIVGYLLTPEGHVPPTLEDRLAVAVDLYQRAAAAGLPEDRLIIDPVVAPVAWEDGLRQNRDFLSIIRSLPDILGFPVRTMAGLSNLTSGHDDRSRKIRLEQAMAPMLAASGLTLLLMNIFHEETVHSARAARLLMTESVFTWASLP